MRFHHRPLDLRGRVGGAPSGSTRGDSKLQEFSPGPIGSRILGHRRDDPRRAGSAGLVTIAVHVQAQPGKSLRGERSGPHDRTERRGPRPHSGPVRPKGGLGKHGGLFLSAPASTPARHHHHRRGPPASIRGGRHGDSGSRLRAALAPDFLSAQKRNRPRRLKADLVRTFPVARWRPLPRRIHHGAQGLPFGNPSKAVAQR